MKVMIAVPNGGTVKSRVMTDVIISMFSNQAQFGFVLADVEGTLGPHNRWLAGQQALHTECDYLWLIDNDMSIPSEALPRLVAHDKEIVGAAYNYRRMPLMTTVKMLNEAGEIIIPDSLPDDLFECHALGSGCKLIKTSALRTIPQPWFALEWGADGGMSKTDDVWFCEQAKKVGIATYCDPTLDVRHIGDFLY
jgi:hypothetical protein